MAGSPKTEEKIRAFFESFNKLSADEKVYFLTEIDKIVAKKDEKDKKLFLALIRAAREEKSCEDAVSEMRKA